MALPLRQVTSTPTSSTIDGTNAAGQNPLTTPAGTPAPVSVASPFGASFNEAAQIVAPGVLQGTVANALVSPADSGPNNAPLEAIGLDLATVIPSPSGKAFAQAMQLTGAGTVRGSAGGGEAQGAVGGAFTCEFIRAFSQDDITNGAVLIQRADPAAASGQLWGVNYSGGNLYFVWTDSAGSTAAYCVYPWSPTVGTPYAIAAVWTGSDLYLFVSGAEVGTAAMASVFTASANGYLAMYGSGAMDEVRLSNIARYTGNYAPASAPFTSDGSTACLYHLDGLATSAEYGAVVSSAFSAELEYQPSIEDIDSSDIIFLARCHDFYNATDIWALRYVPGQGADFVFTDAAGTAYGPPQKVPLTAGVNYPLAVTWDGTTAYFFVGGTLQASVAVGSVWFGIEPQLIAAQPAGKPASGIIDELRLSTVCRYTASYTPASAPFSVDNDTPCLYHLDTASQGLTKLKIGPVPLNHVWTGSIVLENTAATTQWLIKIGGITWGVLTGSGPYGPLDALSGEVLELTTTSAAPANPVGSDVILVFIGQDQHQTEVRSYTSPISPSGIITNSA